VIYVIAHPTLPNTMSADHAWLTPHAEIVVCDGNKDIEYNATVQSLPFLEEEIWRVQIRWDVNQHMDVVECIKCKPRVFLGKRRRTSTQWFAPIRATLWKKGKKKVTSGVEKKGALQKERKLFRISDGGVAKGGENFLGARGSKMRRRFEGNKNDDEEKEANDSCADNEEENVVTSKHRRRKILKRMPNSFKKGAKPFLAEIMKSEDEQEDERYDPNEICLDEDGEEEDLESSLTDRKRNIIKIEQNDQRQDLKTKTVKKRQSSQKKDAINDLKDQKSKTNMDKKPILNFSQNKKKSFKNNKNLVLHHPTISKSSKELASLLSTLMDLPPKSLPHVAVKLAQFFLFVRERQWVWQNRQMGREEWTKDSVLQHVFFCNVYRELDTGTTYFRRFLLDCQDKGRFGKGRREQVKNVLWCSLAYRLVNRVETFTECDGGGIPTLSRYSSYWKSLKKLEAKTKVFTGAHQVMGLERYGRTLLHISERKGEALNKCVSAILDPEKSLKDLSLEVQTIPNVGKFFAWQVLCDLLEAGMIPHATEFEYAELGPGALAGLSLIFGNSFADKQCLLRFLGDAQTKVFGILGVDFPHFDGRLISLKAIEHSLCEFCKYINVCQNGLQCKKRLYKSSPNTSFTSNVPDDKLKCITCLNDCDGVKESPSRGIVQCAGCQSIDSRRNLRRISIPDPTPQDKKEEKPHAREEKITSNPRPISVDSDSVKESPSRGIVQWAGYQSIDPRRNPRRISIHNPTPQDKKEEKPHAREEKITSNPRPISVDCDTVKESTSRGIVQCAGYQSIDSRSNPRRISIPDPTSQDKKEQKPHVFGEKITSNSKPITVQSQKERGPIPFIAWKKEASNTEDPFAPINTLTPVASLVEDLVYGSDSEDIVALTQRVSTGKNDNDR